jgi:tryptophanyl-tRNA synthetase
VSIESVVEQYKDTINYGVFKRALCELLEKELLPIQQRVEEIKRDKLYEEVLNEGAREANRFAQAKLESIYKKIGLI